MNSLMGLSPNCLSATSTATSARPRGVTAVFHTRSFESRRGHCGSVDYKSYARSFAVKTYGDDWDYS